MIIDETPRGSQFTQTLGPMALGNLNDDATADLIISEAEINLPKEKIRPPSGTKLKKIDFHAVESSSKKAIEMANQGNEDALLKAVSAVSR